MQHTISLNDKAYELLSKDKMEGLSYSGVIIQLYKKLEENTTEKSRLWRIGVKEGNISKREGDSHIG